MNWTALKKFYMELRVVPEENLRGDKKNNVNK